MLKLTEAACIDAPHTAVWQVLSELELIPLWVPAIRRAHCPEARRGLGAVRVCELDAATVRETIIEWDEGRSFRYEGVGAPMMKRATSLWSLRPEGARRTLVTSEVEVELKGGGFAQRVFEPVVRAIVVRTGARSLAALKYLVEQGEPFQGRSVELPFEPIGC